MQKLHAIHQIKFDVIHLAHMTADEKMRYGMMALGGASIVLTALGLHISPLQIVGGAGD